MLVHTQRQTALASLLLLLPSFTSALGFDCEHIRVDNVGFNLKPLDGVHEIWHYEKFEDHSTNTSYVLNICNVLNHAATRQGMNCGPSRNICGFEEYTEFESGVVTPRPLPIAGLEPAGGGSKDPEVTRLKTQDPSTEGIRVKLAGGSIKDEEHGKKSAAAVIEFQCDPDRTGLEGLKNDDDMDNKMSRREDEDKHNNDENKGKDKSLQFKSFDLVDDKTWILRLDWKTRYACEDYKHENPSQSSGSGHWGLFTWLIIILFLSAAAYLIFGSWLNYNQYGARGWDLLPHADTIRDVPYIFQDWMRRVVNSLQGSGSRGGYAAV